MEADTYLPLKSALGESEESQFSEELRAFSQDHKITVGTMQCLVDQGFNDVSTIACLKEKDIEQLGLKMAQRIRLRDAVEKLNAQASGSYKDPPKSQKIEEKLAKSSERPPVAPKPVVSEPILTQSEASPAGHGLSNPIHKAVQKLLHEMSISGGRLEILAKIGEGNFGSVFKANLYKEGSDKPTIVAAKTISYHNRPEDAASFMEEAIHMKLLNHKHIIQLFGVLEHEGKPHIVLPFMANGNLRTYVQDPAREFRLCDLLEYGLQVAEGMKYLAEQKYMHGDLAARNCLLSDDGTVKVSDFGLARHMFTREYYRIQTVKACPIKWMALEVLAENKYTMKSDVWSYGVLLWELLTRGQKPYAGHHNVVVVDMIKKGYRLECPPVALPEIYEAMIICWSSDPDERPYFSDICDWLKELLDSHDIAALGAIVSDRTSGRAIGPGGRRFRPIPAPRRVKPEVLPAAPPGRFQEESEAFEEEVCYRDFTNSSQSQRAVLPGPPSRPQPQSAGPGSPIRRTLPPPPVPPQVISQYDTEEPYEEPCEEWNAWGDDFDNDYENDGVKLDAKSPLRRDVPLPPSSKPADIYYSEPCFPEDELYEELDDPIVVTTSTNRSPRPPKKADKPTAETAGKAFLNELLMIRPFPILDPDEAKKVYPLVTGNFNVNTWIGPFGLTAEYCIVNVITQEPSKPEKLPYLKNMLKFLVKLNHQNVLSFLGVMPDDNIPNIVLNNMTVLHEAIKNQTSTPMLDLMEFGLDIAKGLEYIHSKNIVLADGPTTRTCWVDYGHAVIGGFATAHEIRRPHPVHYMRNTRFPIKWMSPEWLRDPSVAYTFAGDVWTLGVCLWEIMSRGAVPYPGMSSQKVINAVPEGYRMKVPDNCPENLSSVMLDCWADNPGKRPTVSRIIAKITPTVTSQRGSESEDIYCDDEYEEQYDYALWGLKNDGDIRKALKNIEESIPSLSVDDQLYDDISGLNCPEEPTYMETNYTTLTPCPEVKLPTKKPKSGAFARLKRRLAKRQ